MGSVRESHQKYADDAAQLHGHRASTEQRFEYFEKSFGTLRDTQNRELGVTKSRLDELSEQLKENFSCMNALSAEMQDHVLGNREDVDAHRTSVVERVNRLEGLFNATRDGHIREMQAQRKALHDLFGLIDVKQFGDGGELSVQPPPPLSVETSADELTDELTDEADKGDGDTEHSSRDGSNGIERE